jgi:hypothetical protein
MINDIYDYIDKCNFNLTHYDVSLIVHKVFKEKYKYIGDKQWQYYDNNVDEWINDKKNEKMKLDIKTIISDLFLTRSMFWYSESQKCDNINEEIHAKLMSEKMVNASYKLKNNNFILVVIREAQSFFDYQND